MFIWVNSLSNSKSKMSSSDSKAFDYTTLRLLWYSKSLYWKILAISLLCHNTHDLVYTLHRINAWQFKSGFDVDQMTYIWSPDKIRYQIQNPSVRDWFHGFVKITSHVLWQSKSKEHSNENQKKKSDLLCHYARNVV